MAGAISRGLTLKDFDNMTIGQIVDYCKTYNDLNKEPEEKDTKIASQKDFDKF
ncbi:hypothetical protein [Peptoniphilus sp. BV3C26]|uniref:hypothetical protein n=1 Tax=Peptoniphilus sp. BV3C26 TaxID=1111134 RepID=UPI0003B85830|nr:hypothetical protein [Peptoniphilus sp. BV3C26]ERT57758.1 hypothetical protein HMPREF1253_0375 [Peptoniphilus sp. BV3C26]